jgi:hypothetical protein
MSIRGARYLAKMEEARRDYAHLLKEALRFERSAFETDGDVNGGDMVEFFATWRLAAKAALDRHGDGPNLVTASLGDFVKDPAVTPPTPE